MYWRVICLVVPSNLSRYSVDLLLAITGIAVIGRLVVFIVVDVPFRIGVHLDLDNDEVAFQPVNPDLLTQHHRDEIRTHIDADDLPLQIRLVCVDISIVFDSSPASGVERCELHDLSVLCLLQLLAIRGDIVLLKGFVGRTHLKGCLPSDEAFVHGRHDNRRDDGTTHRDRLQAIHDFIDRHVIKGFTGHLRELVFNEREHVFIVCQLGIT